MIEQHSPYRFALLAHSSEVAAHVYRAVQGSSDIVRYESVDFETGPALARACLESGSEAILCHGGTGNSIIRALGHSVVAIDRTDMDLIKTLRRAKELSSRVILAAYREEYHDLEEMEALLDLKIHHISYETHEEMFEEVRKAFEQGLRVLVGGGISKQCMEKLGGVGLVIEPSQHSVNKALQHARAMVRQKRQENIRLNNLLEIFSQLQEGVICVDSRGSLVFSNPLALELLNLPPGSTNQTLTPFFGPLGLHEVLRSMEPKPDKVVGMVGESFVVRTYPLAMQGDERLAVAFFRDVSTLRKINRKIEEALYAKGFVARSGVADIIGGSKPVREMKEKLRRFARADAAVLISGETGTGKELAAHALHQESPRRDHPFVAVNFASLSPNLIESELFGYEDGAFTGAKKGGKMGLFEMADQGTLFLDEVAEISHELQLRLLRVLEAGEVMRVGGGNRIFSVDVRVISASHRPLLEMVTAGKFRQDLYYRLSTLKLNIPPLRDRSEDIPLILGKLLERYRKPPSVISPSMLSRLQGYHWPGNIRELLAMVESYLILLEGSRPDPGLFHSILAENDQPKTEPPAQENLWVPETRLKDCLENLKSRIIRQAVDYYQGDKHLTALKLGVSPTTLWRGAKNLS